MSLHGAPIYKCITQSGVKTSKAAPLDGMQGHRLHSPSMERPKTRASFPAKISEMISHSVCKHASHDRNAVPRCDRRLPKSNSLCKALVRLCPAAQGWPVGTAANSGFKLQIWQAAADTATVKFEFPVENIKHSLKGLVTIPQTVRCTLACTGGARRREPQTKRVLWAC